MTVNVKTALLALTAAVALIGAAIVAVPTTTDTQRTPPTAGAAR